MLICHACSVWAMRSVKEECYKHIRWQGNQQHLFPTPLNSCGDWSFSWKTPIKGKFQPQTVCGNTQELLWCSTQAGDVWDEMMCSFLFLSVNARTCMNIFSCGCYAISSGLVWVWLHSIPFSIFPEYFRCWVSLVYLAGIRQKMNIEFPTSRSIITFGLKTVCQ